MSMHNYIYIYAAKHEISNASADSQDNCLHLAFLIRICQEVIAVPVLLEKHSSSWCSRLTTLQHPTCKVLAKMCVNTCQ